LRGAPAGGVYYKTFKWPNWHLFEPAIRRMAGLGRAPTAPDADHYEEVAADADVLVVGAGIHGPCGRSGGGARRARAPCWLASGEHPGGALAWGAEPEVAALAARARQLGVRIQLRTLAFGVYDHNLVCAGESLSPEGAADLPGCVLRETAVEDSRPGRDRRHRRLRAAALVSGQRPPRRHARFGGAQVRAGLWRRLRAARGDRRDSDSAYERAVALRDAGVEIVAVVDRRDGSTAGERSHGLRVITGAALSAVFRTRAVRGCTVTPWRAAVASGFRCDLILNAGRLCAGRATLHSQAGGKLRLAESAMFVPDGAAPGLVSVGACAGVFAREPA